VSLKTHFKIFFIFSLVWGINGEDFFWQDFCMITKAGIHGVFIFFMTRYLVSSTPHPIQWIGIHSFRCTPIEGNLPLPGLRRIRPFVSLSRHVTCSLYISGAYTCLLEPMSGPIMTSMRMEFLMGNWMYTRLRLFAQSKSSQDRLAPVTTCVHVCYSTLWRQCRRFDIFGGPLAESPYDFSMNYH